MKPLHHLSVISSLLLIVCTLVGTFPVSAMDVMLSVVACLDSATELTKSNYTMYFTKYGLNGNAAGILNAGNASSYMFAAYVMPRIVEEFGWHSLLVSLPIMIGVAVLSLWVITKRFDKFKHDSL